MPTARWQSQIGRNDPCPCGSGKKYKKCCMTRAAVAPRAASPAAGPDVSELLRRAAEQQKAGANARAAALYREVLDHRPGEPAALFGLGQIVGSAGDYEQGIELIRRAIEVDGRQSQYHGVLATFLHRRARFDEALAAAERAMKLDPRDPRPFSVAATCLNQMHRTDEAIHVLRKALAIDSDDPRSNVTMAALERRKGDLLSARARYENILSRASIGRNLRREAWHGLGLVLDGLKLYDEAFDAFRCSGEEALQSAAARKLLKNPWREQITELSEGFSRDLLARWTREDFTDQLPAPAFLVGFPRSGTTMTEQIMAAHPDVVTVEERPLIRGLTDRIHQMAGDSGAIAEKIARLRRDQIETLRAAYWEHARSLVAEDLTGKVFVDKLPLNILAVGLINVLFPDAKVVVALRDPRDACLSCLMQFFYINEAMVHFLSLETTADFYAAVMGAWLDMRDKLTLRFLEVRYEDTVSDLRTQAQKILNVLDVDWDENVLNFHETARERFINTPSYAAVSQKVHTRAVARWKNYRRHLAAVNDRLGRFVEAFGYSDADGS